MGIRTCASLESRKSGQAGLGNYTVDIKILLI